MKTYIHLDIWGSTCHCLYSYDDAGCNQEHSELALQDVAHQNHCYCMIAGSFGEEHASTRSFHRLEDGHKVRQADRGMRAGP